MASKYDLSSLIPLVRFNFLSTKYDDDGEETFNISICQFIDEYLINKVSITCFERDPFTHKKFKEMIEAINSIKLIDVCDGVSRVDRVDMMVNNVVCFSYNCETDIFRISVYSDESTGISETNIYLVEDKNRRNVIELLERMRGDPTDEE